MTTKFQMVPVGIVEKEGGETIIRIFDAYGEALDGLEAFSHIWVLYWFDRNDTPEGRGILKVRPRKNPNNPLTGVFATHAPVRPNLVAMTRCRIRFVRGLIIGVDDIDALEGSPVIDIKCYIPAEDSGEVRLPPWATAACRDAR